MLLLLSSGVLADKFVGQASVIDGDTLEILEHVSDYGASTRRRAASYAVARTALNIAVAPRRQMTSAPTLPGAPSTVSHSTSTDMAAPLRLVRSTAPISANGLCTMALL